MWNRTRRSLAALYTLANIPLWFFFGLAARAFAAKGQAARKAGIPKEVIYYGEGYVGRRLKLAKALNDQGIRVRHYFLKRDKSAPMPDYEHPLFGTVMVKSRLHGLWFLMKHRDTLVHLFLDGRHAMAFMLAIARHEKWVLDELDVLIAYDGSHLQAPTVKLWLEKYCFGAAPAVCSRSIELQLLKRKYGVTLHRTVFFPEYPETIQSAARNARAIRKEGVKSVIYGGGVYESVLQPTIKFLEKSRRATLILCCPTKALRASPSYTRVLRLQEQGRIVVHDFLPYDDFMKLIRRCDSGILLADDALRAKIPYAMANKIFDYASVGLVPIANREHFCLRLLKRYVPVASYSTDTGSVEWHTGFHSPDRLLMKNNIERLATFYSSI